MESVLEHDYGQLAKPLHLQRTENALKLNHLLEYVEKIMNDPILSE